jgi:hypothetical protein
VAALNPDKLRDLTLSNTVEGRPDHLSAGSGLVRRGDNLYVIGDDELDLAVFSLADSEPGELVRLEEGELPTDVPARQRDKPDLEAVTTIPPFRFNPYGALLAFGSGSGETRDRAFAWSLDEHGALRGFPRVVALGPLYGFLEQHVAGDLNIEGLAVAGERVALLQRGNSTGGKSQLVYLSLDEVMTSLTSDFAIQASELEEVHDFDLGQLDGVDLHFTDGDSLADGRIVFSAAAEREGDDHPDGGCAGSVIGLIAPDGTLEQMERIDADAIKVEGVDAVLSDRLVHALLVCDADDIAVPSPLLSVTLPG